MLLASDAVPVLARTYASAEAWTGPKVARAFGDKAAQGQIRYVCPFSFSDDYLDVRSLRQQRRDGVDVVPQQGRQRVDRQRLVRTGIILYRERDYPG